MAHKKIKSQSRQKVKWEGRSALKICSPIVVCPFSSSALRQKISVQLSPWSQRRDFSTMICPSFLLLPINSSFTFILHSGAGLRLPKYHHSNAGFLCFRLKCEWLPTTLSICRFQSLLFLLLLSTLAQHVTWNYLIPASFNTSHLYCLSLWWVCHGARISHSFSPADDTVPASFSNFFIIYCQVLKSFLICKCMLVRRILHLLFYPSEFHVCWKLSQYFKFCFPTIASSPKKQGCCPCTSETFRKSLWQRISDRDKH